MTRGSKLCFITCFSSSILVISLLTNYFAPFLAAQEFNFLSRFLYLWHCEVVRRTCAPIFQAQNALVSQSKTLSAFCQRVLKQKSIGRMQIIPFLLTKILKLTLSCMTQAPLSYAVQLGNGILKGSPICESRLIVGFLALCIKQKCGPSLLQNPLQLNTQRTPA